MLLSNIRCFEVWKKCVGPGTATATVRESCPNQLQLEGLQAGVKKGTGLVNTKLELFPYNAFPYLALAGLVVITVLAAEEHHRWNVFLSLPNFWQLYNHISLKREGEDPVSQGSLVTPAKATLVWWGRPTCSSGGRGEVLYALPAFSEGGATNTVDAVSAPYWTSLHSFVIWPRHSRDH